MDTRAEGRGERRRKGEEGKGGEIISILTTEDT